MRVLLGAFWLLAFVCVAPASVWAQATLAGAVRDNTGAVLPGVVVEAASPALIEKVRSATTDGAGRYRIENLQPGAYTVTFSLAGFATVRRENQIVSGSGVITADAELRVGGVQETVTVTGETPVVDVQSTKREVTLDNETMRSLPSVRSYSYLLNTVPGVTTNNNNVNTGPVFADQLGSLSANYTLTPVDMANAAAQIGRPLTASAVTVNLLAPGELYGDRIAQWDFSAKKIIRLGGQRLTAGVDIYNLLNNNVTLAFNPTFVPNTPGWQSPQTYMNPRVFRLNAEFAW